MTYGWNVHLKRYSLYFDKIHSFEKLASWKFADIPELHSRRPSALCTYAVNLFTMVNQEDTRRERSSGYLFYANAFRKFDLAERQIQADRAALVPFSTQG